MSADKRAAMRTTSYPVYRTPVLINLVSLHRTVNIILIITNSKDDAIENICFLVRKSRATKRLALSTPFLFLILLFILAYILSIAILQVRIAISQTYIFENNNWYTHFQFNSIAFITSVSLVVDKIRENNEFIYKLF